MCSFLQALVEASAKRVVNLASKWEKHRAPLIEEHRRLKEICSNQDVSVALQQISHWICYRKKHIYILFICLHFTQLESSRKLSEIKSLHDKIRVSTEEARKKEEIYKRLVAESLYISCEC